MEKKMVKIHFLKSPVIRAPTLLDRSYRHWQKTSQTSWRLSFLLTSSVVRQGLQNKGTGYMRLNRLLNMTTIFMTFFLTYYWLLIFVFRYKKSSSPQVTDGLTQFSDLHLWIKLKHFSFLSASSLQKLETFGFWTASSR